MQVIKLVIILTIASTVSALNLRSSIAIVHGNFSTPANINFAASYLAPFAAEDAVEQPFELIDDHEDMVINHQGALVSLRKRDDDCQKYHKAVSGDNCYTLALKYNVAENSLHVWNEQINSGCTNLYIGKSYCVKKEGEMTLETACAKTYVVQSVDTCISVSKAHEIRLDTFYDMNPSINKGSCDNLLTGGSYCVKQSTKSVTNAIVNKAAKKLELVTSKRPSIKKKSRSRKFASSRRTKHSQKSKKANLTITTTTLATTSTIRKTTTIHRATTTTTEKKAKATGTSEKKNNRKLLQKGSDLTYYWIAHPDDYDHKGKSVTVKTCNGDSLGTVSEEYADALVMEGTGIIGNKIINLGGCSCSDYKCFMEVDKKEDPYGLTSFGSPLRPFITVAANDIKRNTKIFIPSIVGWEIPGSSKKHNGCLLVDDRSWSFDSNHIDFYVYREKNYRSLNGEHKVGSVDVYEGGDCNLLNYI
ncbi:hypothetical protein [Parasitella parasitica]|uniref:LysM domain-containing protein n=1 Tax=Parasitella parasitica TaxID=35722 RepID=A0A0B7N8E4_9FUNG|nr:hypothetical protein [Parasitella parasitica]